MLSAVNGADTGANVKTASEGNVPSVPSVPSSVIIPQQAAQRNYASRECGAKVLFSNDEAENKVCLLNTVAIDSRLSVEIMRSSRIQRRIDRICSLQPTVYDC